MTYRSINSMQGGHRTELVMNDPITDDCDTIDRKTIRSICDSVGELLRQRLTLEASRPSHELQHLLDELRRRDGETRS
jgi:hypothetical protein